jgi:hypothetical protein
MQSLTETETARTVYFIFLFNCGLMPFLGNLFLLCKNPKLKVVTFLAFCNCDRAQISFGNDRAGVRQIKA